MAIYSSRIVVAFLVPCLVFSQVEGIALAKKKPGSDALFFAEEALALQAAPFRSMAEHPVAKLLATREETILARNAVITGNSTIQPLKTQAIPESKMDAVIHHRLSVLAKVVTEVVCASLSKVLKDDDDPLPWVNEHFPSLEQRWGMSSDDLASFVKLLLPIRDNYIAILEKITQRYIRRRIISEEISHSGRPLIQTILRITGIPLADPSSVDTLDPFIQAPKPPAHQLSPVLSQAARASQSLSAPVAPAKYPQPTATAPEKLMQEGTKRQINAWAHSSKRLLRFLGNHPALALFLIEDLGVATFTLDGRRRPFSQSIMEGILPMTLWSLLCWTVFFVGDPTSMYFALVPILLVIGFFMILIGQLDFVWHHDNQTKRQWTARFMGAFLRMAATLAGSSLIFYADHRFLSSHHPVLAAVGIALAVSVIQVISGGLAHDWWNAFWKWRKKDHYMLEQGANVVNAASFSNSSLASPGSPAPTIHPDQVKRLRGEAVAKLNAAIKIYAGGQTLGEQKKLFDIIKEMVDRNGIEGEMVPAFYLRASARDGPLQLSHGDPKLLYSALQWLKGDLIEYGIAPQSPLIKRQRQTMRLEVLPHLQQFSQLRDADLNQPLPPEKQRVLDRFNNSGFQVQSSDVGRITASAGSQTLVLTGFQKTRMYLIQAHWEPFFGVRLYCIGADETLVFNGDFPGFPNSHQSFGPLQRFPDFSRARSDRNEIIASMIRLAPRPGFAVGSQTLLERQIAALDDRDDRGDGFKMVTPVTSYSLNLGKRMYFVFPNLEKMAYDVTARLDPNYGLLFRFVCDGDAILFWLPFDDETGQLEMRAAVLLHRNDVKTLERDFLSENFKKLYRPAGPKNAKASNDSAPLPLVLQAVRVLWEFGRPVEKDRLLRILGLSTDEPILEKALKALPGIIVRQDKNDTTFEITGRGLALILARPIPRHNTSVLIGEIGEAMAEIFSRHRETYWRSEDLLATWGESPCEALTAATSRQLEQLVALDFIRVEKELSQLTNVYTLNENFDPTRSAA